jgi:hypothetical protein
MARLRSRTVPEKVERLPMRNSTRILMLGLAFSMVVLMGLALADDLSERLRETLDDKHAKGTDLWIYNDLNLAKKQAARENKPIFVTFRCVPCKSCAAFDATVAQGNEVIERLARDKFVSIRQVEMKGVDLTQFEFDYDLNWAAMFINADGTVYARYGTQSAEGPDAYNSIAGLETTMRRVLELHANYPANKAELEAKRGKQKPYRTALEMPGLENKEKRKGATTRSNCIHCHNIHDAEFAEAQSTGKYTEDMLWRYPLPDNLGLIINAKDGRLVYRVLADSPAAKAGIEPGEEITHINGQAITSIADIQWALNPLPNGGTKVKVTASKTGERTLDLAQGWKKTDISWRGSIWSVEPKLNVWAPELTPAERRERGLPAEETALLVKWINTGEPGGRAAHESGLREGDVIVALEGKPLGDWTTNQFNVHVKLNYKVGDTLPLTIKRGKETQTIKVKLVD